MRTLGLNLSYLNLWCPLTEFVSVRTEAKRTSLANTLGSDKKLPTVDVLTISSFRLLHVSLFLLWIVTQPVQTYHIIQSCGFRTCFRDWAQALSVISGSGLYNNMENYEMGSVHLCKTTKLVETSMGNYIMITLAHFSFRHEYGWRRHW